MEILTLILIIQTKYCYYIKFILNSFCLSWYHSDSPGMFFALVFHSPSSVLMRLGLGHTAESGGRGRY